MKATTVAHQVVGDGMVEKAACVNQGDLLAEGAGVHGYSPEEPG